MANKRKYPKKNRRFNVSLDPRIWKAAKKQAFKEEISLAYYVVESIIAYTKWLRIADRRATVVGEIDVATEELKEIQLLQIKLKKEEKLKKRIAKMRATLSRKKRRFPGMLRR